MPTYYREAITRRRPRADQRPRDRSRRRVRAWTSRWSSPRWSRCARAWSSTEADYKGVKVDEALHRGHRRRRSTTGSNRLRERFAELEPVERPVAGRRLRHDRRDGHGRRRGGRRGSRAPTTSTSSARASSGRRSTPSSSARSAGDILKFTEELAPSAGEELAGKDVDMHDPREGREGAEPARARRRVRQDRLGVRHDRRSSVTTCATQLGELKEREADGVVRDRVLQAMIDTVEVDLPESLVEDETDHRVAHAKERAERAGLTIDQLLEAQGWDEARLREDSRDHAVRAITADLVLEGDRPLGGPRGDGRRDRRRDRPAGPGVRPRAEGAGETARPKRSDRDAGRRYHPSARHSTSWSSTPISRPRPKPRARRRAPRPMWPRLVRRRARERVRSPHEPCRTTWFPSSSSRRAAASARSTSTRAC